jgi:hypothetical protein
LSAEDAELRELIAEAESDLPGAVRAVIVHDDDFVSEIWNRIENGDELGNDRGNVFTFVVGGEDQRHIDAGVSI